MRVAVLCPTRDRPQGLISLSESVNRTSKARLLAYVDQDQNTLYQDTGGALVTVGERIGPVAAANLMVERFGDYDVYGLVTDDSIITTPGWDEWVLEVVKQFPNRICLISPHHNHGNHVDMPFVTKEWIKTVGWYACPEFYHYVWPTVSGLIGEMTAIVHAPQQMFHVEHDDHVQNRQKQIDDEAGFYQFASLRLPPIVERVRQAMA